MKRRSLIKYLFPAIVLYIIIIFIYYTLYLNTIDIIKSEYSAKSQLIEKSIANEIKYTEALSQIVDKDVTSSMKNYSEELINMYQGESNILSWDLEILKEKFEGLDIYILNEKLEIVKSTVEDEIGLNFNDYPSFSKTLRNRLNGNEFKSDSVKSLLNAELRKYSYMPTPDNKFLIELGLNVSKKYPIMGNLDVISLSRKLKEEYPFIRDIRVYKYNKDKENSIELDSSTNISLNNMVALNKNENENVKKALETNHIQEQIIKDGKNSYTFKYIPYISELEDNEVKWWGAHVVEVSYDDKILNSNINHQKNLFIKSILILSLLYLTSTFLILYVIKKNRDIANQDHLTKLANRKKFEEELEVRMKEADKKGSKLAVLFFDLDKFKKVNDTFGHSVGDMVLIEVGRKIRKGIPKGDLASRLGGDEFIALLSNIDSEEQVLEMASEISRIFDKSLDIEGIEIPMKPSIGISIYPNDANTTEQLITKADNAMYEAKAEKIGFKIYKETDNKKDLRAN